MEDSPINFTPTTSPKINDNKGQQETASAGIMLAICRFVAIALITIVFCYLLRLILCLVYQLVTPLVVITMAYITYANEGLHSWDGFKKSLNNLTTASRTFLSGLYDIWIGVKTVLT